MDWATQPPRCKDSTTAVREDDNNNGRGEKNAERPTKTHHTTTGSETDGENEARVTLRIAGLLQKGLFAQ